MKKLLVFGLLVLAVAGHAQDVRELHLRSIKAHRYKDYPTFLELMKTIDSLRPWHPTYTYNLACAYALNNRPEKALVVLKKSVMMDSEKDFEAEDDLESLKNHPDYQKMVALKASQNKEVVTSKKEITLSEKTLHPEGLVHLQKKNKWLVGSVRHGKIVEFDIKTGKCTDWLDTDLPVFAMKPDASEKYLWVATSAVAEMVGYTSQMEGKGEILKVNIKSKIIEKRYTVLGKHTFGDLIVSKNGVVYISDSYSAGMYKIEDDAMLPWFRITDKICNFQGITFNDDETRLYLADYFNGIAEVNTADPSDRHWLTFPDGTVQKGIDGLEWHENSLIAIHNGVKPIRIVRYFLDSVGNIGSYKIIDNNRPEFKEPTIGHVAKGKFYFFANSPWQAYDKKSNLDESKVEAPALYSFSLAK